MQNLRFDLADPKYQFRANLTISMFLTFYAGIVRKSLSLQIFRNEYSPFLKEKALTVYIRNVLGKDKTIYL